LCWLKRLSALRKLIIMLGFGPKGFYDDLTSSVRFHRILRRGREYGSELSPEQALEPAPMKGNERLFRKNAADNLTPRDETKCKVFRRKIRAPFSR